MNRDRKDPWEEIRRDLEALGAEEPEEVWEERVLCEDEACIGLVGEDGHCRVCGRAQSPGRKPHETIREEAPQEPHPVTLAEEEEEEEDDLAFDDDISTRVLCSDGSCIGLVGEDGYCRVCGLLWKAEGYAEEEPGIYRDDPEE